VEIVITLEAGLGSNINDTIRRAIRSANTGSDSVQFEFNGVTVIVTASSRPSDVYRDWLRGLCGYLGKNPTVGPVYAAELKAAELASDAAIETQNKARREHQRQEMERADAAKKNELDSILNAAGPLLLTDQAAWNANTILNSADPYSARVVSYASDWGRLMQAKMASGANLEDIASDTSHMADTDGITGFMYGAAVAILSKFWVHGDRLRRWHNKDTQLGTEGDAANESGGVLNTAIISIGQ
jgi:hypothetical protein